MTRLDDENEVVAFPVSSMLAHTCAFPGCTATGQWTIMGPALIEASLPDVCEAHLDYGSLLGSGKGR